MKFLLATLLATLALSQSACVVFAVADVVGTVAVKTVGVAADVAIGTVKVTGKVVGAVLPGGGDDKPETKK